MKQESMPLEQDGMALAAEAPSLDAEDTPKVDESAPAEATSEVEATSQQEPTVEETPAAEGEALAAPAPDQEKANFFSKIWGILTAKPEITVPIVLIFSLVLGLIIGYSVVGDGPVKDVFKPETWTHIVRLVFG